MTRLITNTNKVVVPKDYIKCVGEHSYLPLSRVEATTHSVDVSSISPFDFVYEEGYNYTAISENVDIKGEPIDPIDITYKIIFNIYFPAKSVNFLRFILRPNIDVMISRRFAEETNYITPCLQVTINEVFGVEGNPTIGDTFVTRSKTITINLDPKEDLHYASKENGYSIIYNMATAEIYDDTENGTLSWAENQTAAASESGVMTTSMDDEATPAADIQLPSVDINPSILESGARINKAVMPQDYARLIYSPEVTRQYSLNVNHDLTTIDLTKFPNYDIVGEINCKYTDEGYKNISVDGTLGSFPSEFINNTYTLSSRIVNKYRLIRIIEKPNLSLINSGDTIISTVMYIVTIKIDGDENEYQKQIPLSYHLKQGEEITTGNKKYAFIFDTKTKEFYDDTENGTGLWSSKYRTTSTILPNVPIL